jgi:hypothetical protein
VKDYGYRPMPGITDVQIQTQGRLGSIRQATVNFKVWTKDQLDIIDTLYFKMGYHMFLEWGHMYYYDMTGKLNQMGPTIDPFAQNLTKEQLLINIAKKKDETNCNYDAMIGMCTHFTFTFNQEGGYDCTIKLIGLGTLADSMKINSISGIPVIQQKEIKDLYNTFRTYKREQIAAERSLEAPLIQPTAGTSQNFLQLTASIQDDRNYIIKTSEGEDLVIMPANPKSRIPNGGLFYKGKKIFISPIESVAKNYYKQVKLKNPKDLPVFNKIITQIKDCLTGVAKETSDSGELPVNPPGAAGDYSYKQRIKIFNNGVKLNYYASLQDPLVFQMSATCASDPDKFGRKYLYDITVQLSDDFINKNSAYLWTHTMLVNGDANNKKNIFFPPNGKPPDVSKRFTRFADDAIEYFNQVMYDFVTLKANFPNQHANTNLVIQDGGNNFLKKSISPSNLKRTDFPDTNDTPVINIQNNTFTVSFNPIYGYSKIQYAGVDVNNDPIILTKDVAYGVWITTNDGAIIDDIVTDETSFQIQDRIDEKNRQAAEAEAKALQEQYEKEKEEINKEIDIAVKEEGFKYASAIESALRIIQIHSLNEAVGNPNKPEFDFREIKVSNLMQPQSVSGSIAEAIFANSLFKDKIKDFVNNSNLPSDKVSSWVLQGLKPSANKQDRLKSFTAYGFNHNLMASQNPEQFVYDHELKTCDFEGMFKSYVVPYDISTEVLKNIDSNHPVYIRFDLLLFLLNSMSLLYDSPGSPRSTKVLSPNKTQNTDVIQTPLLYIDFNTHTNTCLSAPIQMSIDVLKFLIPFRGTAELYKTLFNDEHLKAIDEESKKSQASKNEDSDTEIDKDLASEVSKTDALFDPANKDAISASLPEFKSTENADKAAWYGKIMNVVVGIDYLLSVFQQHSANDDSHSVNLRPFIQQILADMNKSFGDINYFRFGYKDESNCMYIADDQSSPLTGKDEKSPTVNKNQKSTGKYGDLEFDNNSIELPLYGRRSIAKSIEIRTEVSSKLSNMLAISANADKKSAAGKNSTAFGQYNENYINRYVEQSTEPNIDAKKILDGERNAAIAFNDYVVSIFSQDNPKLDQTDSAMNYYIERMNSKVAEYQATRASAMIPVSVNFETDGISGVSMGQAFTLPEQLLPRTYQRYENENGVRVGFVMTGVQESISSNIWNTTIKANMFFMKKESDYKIDKKLYNVNPLSQSIFEGQSNIIGNNGGSSNTNFTGNNADARKAIETYIGRSITDIEFKELISGTFAEASLNQKERAWVMGTILNRSRNSGASISVELRKPNQFQSVTGTSKDGHRASSNFTNGPSASAAESIYGAAINILSIVPKNIIYFTAANLNAYGPGTNPGYITTLQNRGGVVIGQTIFSA